MRLLNQKRFTLPRVMKSSSIQTESPKPNGSPMRPFTVKNGLPRSFNQTATSPPKHFAKPLKQHSWTLPAQIIGTMTLTIVVIRATDGKE